MQNVTYRFVYTLTMSDSDAIAFPTKQTYDKLIDQFSSYFETTAFALNSVDIVRNRNGDANVSLVLVSISMLTDKCDLDYMNSFIIKHNNNKDIFKLMNNTVVQVDLKDLCSNQTVIFQNYAKKGRFFNMNEDFLLAVLVPSAIIGSMLIVSSILACILHKRSRKYYRANDTEPLSPIYKKRNKAYLSKGVPVILYEEMAEKQIDDDEDLNGVHLKPLIMRDEKPPVEPPAPPEYSKFTGPFDSFNNGIVEAPLAQAEYCNDDSFGLIQQKHMDDLYYQPPKPIVGLKDVQRRIHTMTNRDRREVDANILP